MELVVIQNRSAVTSSLVVAESFEKEHKHVLESIRKLMQDGSEFRQMFYEGNLPDRYGRERKVYFMNRDGFTMLSMTFSGNKARKFQYEYIKAFNEMEERLLQLNRPSYQIEDEILRAERWIEEQKEKKELLLIAEENKQKVEKLIHSNKVYTATEIGKELGISGTALNKFLVEKGIQYKVNGTYVLKAQYEGKNYTSIKQGEYNGKIIYDRRFTGEGRQFILDLFEGSMK